MVIYVRLCLSARLMWCLSSSSSSSSQCSNRQFLNCHSLPNCFALFSILYFSALYSYIHHTTSHKNPFIFHQSDNRQLKWSIMGPYCNVSIIGWVPTGPFTRSSVCNLDFPVRFYHFSVCFHSKHYNMSIDDKAIWTLQLQILTIQL